MFCINFIIFASVVGAFENQGATFSQCDIPVKMWIYIYWGVPVLLYIKTLVVVRYFRNNKDIVNLNTQIDSLYSLASLAWLIYGTAIYYSGTNNCGDPTVGSAANNMNGFMFANIVTFLFVMPSLFCCCCCLFCCSACLHGPPG